MFLGISYPHWLVLVSCAIAIIGPISYIRDMMYGKVQPNLVSWFLWGSVPLIGIGAALDAGADIRASMRILTSGLMPLIVFCFGVFGSKSYWKLTIFDYGCGILAVCALIFWLYAKDPMTALYLAIVADLLASFPTIRKSRTHPESESALIYIMGIIGVVLVIPSIPVWNVVNAGFQSYLLIVNVIILFALYRKKLFGFLNS